MLRAEQKVAPFDLVVEEGLRDSWKLLIKAVNNLKIDHLCKLLPDLELFDLLLFEEALEVLCLVVCKESVLIKRKVNSALVQHVANRLHFL